jgi:inner membrane protein
MDSVSQFALGAAIGEAVLGRSLGRKAILLGGLIGTLPDMDVLVHYADAVESFTYHRSWSHSVLTLTLFSPLLAWLLHRLYPTTWLPTIDGSRNLHQRPTFTKWWLCVWLILFTHPILDGFTVYGTQLLWPLPVKPVAWGSIFIIDPLYTLPLLIAIAIALKYRHVATTAANVGLTLSSAYLALTLVSQHNARTVANTALNKQSLATNNVLIAPAPFSLLWRVVSMDDEHYHEGFYSLLDKNKNIQFASFKNNRAIIDQSLDHWPVSRLRWFTNDMISASVKDEKLVINDLRMGIEASYIFRFEVGAWQDDQLDPTTSTLLPIQLDNARMRKITSRVFNENINLFP